MSITLDGERIRVTGDGRIEDAETLVALLQAHPGRLVVDLTAAGRLHTALVQVLLAFRPALAGPAGDPFLDAWILPVPRQPGGTP